MTAMCPTGQVPPCNMISGQVPPRVPPCNMIAPQGTPVQHEQSLIIHIIVNCIVRRF